MFVYFYFCGVDVFIFYFILVLFFSVWYRMSDDVVYIDYYTTEDFNKVFRVFVVSYLYFDVLYI